MASETTTMTTPSGGVCPSAMDPSPGRDAKYTRAKRTPPDPKSLRRNIPNRDKAFFDAYCTSGTCTAWARKKTGARAPLSHRSQLQPTPKRHTGVNLFTDDDYTRDEVFVEKAKHCYDKVLEVREDHLASLNTLATLYAMRDERDLAIEILERMLTISPEDDEDKKFLSQAQGQLDELKSI